MLILGQMILAQEKYSAAYRKVKMARHFVIFVGLLLIPAAVVGCRTVQVEPEEPSQIESGRTQLPETEPLRIELPEPEEPETQSPQAEPNEAQPELEEPPKPEPPRPEPNEPEPADANQPDAQGPQTEPSKSEPAESEPNKPEDPKGEPPKPEPNEPKAGPKVSFHDKCAALLTAYVDKKGMVDYDTLRRKRLELKHLLDQFARLQPKQYNAWPQDDKIALWINAHNIKMLDVIVDNYPIESHPFLRVIWGPYSIRHIDKRIGGIYKQKFIVMDEEFTLDEVENRFFRRKFDDPRVFFALSRACLSSPPLRNEPYCGEKLYAQLDDQVRKFLAGSFAFKIDTDKKVVYLSPMLQPTWFGTEFVERYGTNKKFKDQGPATRAVLNFLTKYVDKKDMSFLELETYTVQYLKYNWTLNDSSRKE